ncbi:MAG: DUF523 and DUF1722 domain-containing protein [Spirochaetales bacterium]|nr:DUF523 and DUF1722 domain-containing protein [Spirochaetales bacterium]
MAKPLVGISTCLLGKDVRYNGGHKLDRYLRDVLGQFVDYFPVCPEAECGLGIPREPVRLVEVDGRIRLMTQNTGLDKTGQMESWMNQKLPELVSSKLCGFIFKAKSPSSGLYRIKVYRKNGFSTDGRGIFAKALTDALPTLPVEDEGRLHDPGLRENFIERIFVMKRWNELLESKLALGPLVEFHSTHKYLIMSHSPQALKELGSLVAKGKDYQSEELYRLYFDLLINALGEEATVQKNTNTLEHIMGYFKKDLSADEKAELKELIARYHQKQAPLIVPVTLLNHYVRKYKPSYLEHQWYLQPHPYELMLRNHV